MSELDELALYIDNFDACNHGEQVTLLSMIDELEEAKRLLE